MLILVHKTTGQARPAPSYPVGKGIGPQQGEEQAEAAAAAPEVAPPPEPPQSEDEVLIDSSHQIYKPETGEIIEVPPWEPPIPEDLPARLAALESRLAALEARLVTKDEAAEAHEREAAALSGE